LALNYVLIDLENVQPKDIDCLDPQLHEVWVFVGALQNKLPSEFGIALSRFRGNVEQIEISKTGNNALDFHLTYYIGKLSDNYPHSRYFIISKDKGYDPLVTHLNQNRIYTRRVISASDIINFQGS